MSEIRLLRGLAELRAVAPAWERLWRAAPAATPFQSPHWLLPWFETFAPGELLSAAAPRGDALAALLPFYLETGERTRLLPLGVSLSDYLDALGEPGACAAAAARLAEAPWDEWRFENLPPDAAAWNLPAPPGVVEHVEAQDACPVLDLTAPLPARQRRKLRRARAVAERLGGLQIEGQTSPRTFLDALFALHGERWRARGEGGVLADARVQAFHRAALPECQAAGLSRTFLVSIGGRAAGAYYGFRCGRRAYAYLGGFDPAFAEASPGALAIEAAIAEAVEAGAHELHFLRGREAYKYAWGARDRINRARVWRRA